MMHFQTLKGKIHPNDSFFSSYPQALRGSWRPEGRKQAFKVTTSSKEKVEDEQKDVYLAPVRGELNPSLLARALSITW